MRDQLEYDKSQLTTHLITLFLKQRIPVQNPNNKIIKKTYLVFLITFPSSNSKIMD